VGNLVPFTDNFRDLSNAEGYQFEFHCERCGNGFRSGFQRDKVEMGRGMLRAVGSLFGGKVEELSNATQQWRYDRATNSPAKDRALTAAVNEVKDQFRQCRGCGDWMCATQCWNDTVGQCLRCSPSVAEEVARAQSAAQRDQIWQAAQQHDWTANVNVETRATLNCPTCGTKTSGGKFCASCGSSLSVAVKCSGCGFADNATGAMFCSECGNKLG
jgi:hypothetical protein